MTQSPYYSATEAAAILGLSSRQVERLCVSGDLAGAFHVGRAWVIPIQSVKDEKAKRDKANKQRAGSQARPPAR